MKSIPGFVFDQACKVCKTVLSREGIDVKALVEAFGKIGVTPEMIEKRLTHNITALSPHEAVQLRTIYASIRDGFKPVSEYFEVEPISQEQQKSLSIILPRM